MSAPFDNTVDRKFAPVGWMSTIALVVTIVGGITLASYAPRHAPTAVGTTLMIVALALMAVTWATLSRQRDFAWRTFTRVFRWALLAYVIEGGVIEFAFVRDHARGSTLAIVSLLLVVFATSVPTTIAFTVARYADPGS